MEHTLEILEANQLSSTIFITHETPLLERMKKNINLELGIHPNFNELLNHNSIYSAQEIIADYMKIVPEAISVRTHALASGTLLSRLFCQAGLRYESNIYYHVADGRIPQPYKEPGGMIRLLHFWEDDCQCIHIRNGEEKDWDVTRFLNYDGIKIFDFHPIHVFLNTSDLELYEKTRPFHRNRNELSRYCNKSMTEGSGAFLRGVIREAKERGLKFGKISDIVLDKEEKRI